MEKPITMKKQTIVQIIEDWLYKMEGITFGDADKAEFEGIFRQQIINACIEAGSWGKDSSYSDTTLKIMTEWSYLYFNETYGKEETK